MVIYFYFTRFNLRKKIQGVIYHWVLLTYLSQVDIFYTYGNLKRENTWVLISFKLECL